MAEREELSSPIGRATPGGSGFADVGIGVGSNALLVKIYIVTSYTYISYLRPARAPIHRRLPAMPPFDRVRAARQQRPGRVERTERVGRTDSLAQGLPP